MWFQARKKIPAIASTSRKPQPNRKPLIEEQSVSGFTAAAPSLRPRDQIPSKFRNSSTGSPPLHPNELKSADRPIQLPEQPVDRQVEQDRRAQIIANR